MQRGKQHRKACDFCYRRKIKCDAAKPRCFHCEVYDSSCTYGTASRKVVPKDQAATKSENATKSRIEELEDNIKNCLDRVEQLELAIASSGDQEFLLSHEPNDRASIQRGGSGWADWELPPIHKILPMVERYLTTTNAILPLFNPGTLVQTVKIWFDTPQLRNRTNWAVINVVLALAHCLSDPDDSIVIGSTSTYLNHVQSVLTELIIGDADLAVVQVVVGVAMLFQSTNNPKPAAIVITTALKLAHSLGLHLRDTSERIDPTVASQRNRVFWMAYILDRDISMRTAQPPVQRDEDISVDLPPVMPDTDLAGFVFAADGIIKWNFFRARIQLAYIQGKVYDYAYSVSGLSVGPDEASANAVNMIRLLDGWVSQIPTDFQATTLALTDPLGLSRQFCILYSSSHFSRFLISKSSSWDPKWIGCLQDYGSKLSTGESRQVAPVPQGWLTLLRESRQFMALFMKAVPKRASFIWMTSCPYYSSMVCLMAQTIFNPQHDFVGYDRQLIDAGMVFLDEFSEQTGLESVQRLFSTCKELHSYIRSIS